MTRSFLAALLLAAAMPAFSQPVPPQIAQLRDSALQDNYAWDIVEGLTTEIGPRLAGTEQEARARAWSVPARRGPISVVSPSTMSQA